MKLIRLEILNLASLDNPDGEIIDFNQGVLGECNIFSIVGPTGSGKSTLLDAICLALYNRAPRYPLRKGDRNQKIEIFGDGNDPDSRGIAPTDCRNILTRGKKTGYSKLTFNANNGATYRAEWHVKFNRTQFADNVTLLYKLVTAPDGTACEEESDWNQLPQIIGLDFEQFLRTVLIAQGSFANFLSAKEDERFELLEKLIGSEDLYTRIALEIKNQRDIAVEQYNQISATVDAIKQNVLEDEARHALENEINQLEEAERTLNERLKQVDEGLKWFDDDEKKLQAINDRRNELEKANAALTASSESFTRLSLHDAIDPAVDLLRDARRIGKEINQLSDNITELKEEISRQEGLVKSAETRIDQLNKSLTTAQQARTDAAPHIAQARELKIKIAGAQEAFTEKKNALHQAQKSATEAQKKLNDNAASTIEAEKALEQAQDAQRKMLAKHETEKKSLLTNLDNIDGLIKSEQHKIQDQDANALQQAKTRADNALHNLQDAIKVVKNQAEASSEKQQKTEERDQLIRQNEQLQQELATLDIDSLSQDVEALQRTITLMTSQQWAGHRDLLHEGKPCPLCGATHHPYRDDTTKAQAIETELRTQLTVEENKLRKQRARQTELSGNIKLNEGKISELDKRLKQLVKSISELDGKWEELQRLNPSLPHESDVLATLVPSQQQAQQLADEALAAYNKVKKYIDDQIKQKEIATKDLTDFIEKAGRQASEAEKKISDCTSILAGYRKLAPTLSQQNDEKQRELHEAKSACDKISQEVEQLQADFKRELKGEEPDDVEKRLDTAINELSADLEKAKEQHKAHNDKLSHQQGIQQTQKKQLETRHGEKAAKDSELACWLEAYNRQDDKIKEVTTDDVSFMLDATDDWETIRRTKEQLTQAHNTATALFNQATQDHLAHQGIKPEESQAALTSRRQELQQSSQHDKLIERNVQLKKHNDAVDILSTKAQEVTTAQRNLTDWKQITDAIGGEGKTLRQIAQCYTLRFLIDHANEEIRKFNSRYELQQVKNSLGIRVIDHDRADEVRDTTSLSGGETFIVSLGLALGLSSLSSRNISFDNLFIDEGFGTLDPDTLATVIDSLTMLQNSQHKKVGVISHTDTMSERITTQIRVVKNGASGSSHIEIHPSMQPGL